jgi:hypothetical protein
VRCPSGHPAGGLAPLRTILGERSLGLAPAHRLGLDPGGVLSELDLLGPSRDSVRAAGTIQCDKYEVFGPESSPGNRIWDLYPDCTFTQHLPSKSDEDVIAYQADLKCMWLEACADEFCLVVTVDAAVPKVATFQAVVCALIFRGGAQVDCVISAAGRRTPPEVERFTLQLGISAALSRGCQQLVVFSDSMPAVETLLDTSPRSGQIFSLDACKALHPWFAGDGDRSLTMWHVPSRWEWGMHKKAHDAAASKISVGARPRTLRDFWLAEVDTHSLCDWHCGFSEPAYQGQNFLDLEGSKKNSSLRPSKGVLGCELWGRRHPHLRAFAGVSQIMPHWGRIRCNSILQALWPATALLTSRFKLGTMFFVYALGISEKSTAHR